MNDSKATVLAPLITPFAFTSYAYFSDVSGFNMDDGFLTFLGFFIVVFFTSIPVASLYMHFIGFRFYRLLLKKNLVNILTLTLGGVFVADIPMLLIWPIAELSGNTGFYLTLQLFSFVGFAVGLNFWALLNFDQLRDNFKKKSN